MLKLVAYTTTQPKLRLEIEEDKSLGFYLLVYPHDSDQSQADYLQDTLQFAMEEAQERYGVALDGWFEKPAK